MWQPLNPKEMVYVILEGDSADRRAAVGDSLDALAGLLRPLPKVELHAHLSGCLRLSTIVDFSKDSGIRFSRVAEQDLAGVVVLRHPARSYGWSFSPWKRVIDKVTSVPANHYRMTYEVAQDMAADGVVYAELRTSVRLPLNRTSLASMLQRMDEAAAAAARDFGIDIRFLLGFNRQQFVTISQEEQVEIAKDTLDVAEKYRHLIVGFDVWGNENRRPPRAFAKAYATIRSAGYPLAIHAGETGSVENIRQAIDVLQCRRLGHATAIVNDRELMRKSRDKEVAVEVCLTSNTLTGVLAGVERHPVAQMLRAGVPVCLCADNTLVYGTTLSREYALAVRAGLIAPGQLLEIAEGVAAMTFLAADERARLARRLQVSRRQSDELVLAMQSMLTR